MPHINYKNFSSGFTLVEIMLTITIISVLTAVVLPSVGNFTDSNMLNQTLLNIASDLENAKFKALSGAYSGPSNIPANRVNWGLSNCPNSPTNQYTLTPFNIATNAPVAAAYSRTISLPVNTTMQCSNSTIIFQRLSGNPILGGGTIIRVFKGSYSGTITVSNTGVISVSRE